jgi:hypothetical protein
MSVAQIPLWTAVTGALAGTATNSAPTVVTDGVARTDNRRGVPLHMAIVKDNTATVSVYGWSTALAAWFMLETYTYTDSINRAEPMEYAAAYDRIYFNVTANGGTVTSISMGEIDEGPY